MRARFFALPLFSTVLFTFALGCSAPPDAPAGEAVANETSVAFDEQSITLDLTSTSVIRAMPVNGGSLDYLAVRAGSPKTFTLGATDVFGMLHPGVTAPNASASETDPQKRAAAETRLEQLGATVTGIFRRDGVEIGRQTVATTRARSYPQTFNVNSVLLDTAALAVPSTADEMLLAVALRDGGDPSAHVTIAETQLARIVIIGGHADRKNEMFINTVEHGRVEQVLERGKLPKGGTVTLNFDRDRAEALVDYSRLDRFIGTDVGYQGYRQAIYGQVSFDIVGGYRFDAGPWQTFALTKNANSVAAGEWYTLDIQTPANAGQLEVFYEVKGTMVADYSGHQTVVDKRYGQGDKIPMGDTFDNKDGVSGRNYILPLE